MQYVFVGTWRVSLVFLLILISGAGCSKRSRFSNRFSVDRISEIPKGVTLAQYLDNFPVLDEQGRERPINPTGEIGHYPLGVLITVTESSINYCSTSQAVEGFAVANAHCVENKSIENSRVPVKSLYLLFYGKDGKKRVAQPVDYGYVGSRKKLDIVVLKLSNELKDTWAHAGAAIADTSEDADGKTTIEREPPHLFQVKAWVFDPRPRTDTRYGRTAMRFNPRLCTASRTKFTFMGHWMENGELQSKDIPLEAADGVDPNDSSVHFIFDQCKAASPKGMELSPIVNGNSGGLATRAGDFREMVGVVHWKFGSRDLDPKHQYLGYSIKGNEAFEKPRRIVREQNKSFNLFSSGTAFESVLKLIPDLFSPSGPAPVKPTT